MSYLERDLHVPSAGWAWLDAPTRRTSATYLERAREYTTTHQRLHKIRSELLSLAVQANMQPPLIRPDIRIGSRNNEIVATLGSVGVSLLAQHELASRANTAALLDLRSENNRIYSVGEATTQLLIVPTPAERL